MSLVRKLRRIAGALLFANVLAQSAVSFGSQDLDVVRSCLGQDAGSSDKAALESLVQTCSTALKEADVSARTRSELLEARGTAYRNLGQLELSLVAIEHRLDSFGTGGEIHLCSKTRRRGDSALDELEIQVRFFPLVFGFGDLARSEMA